MTGFGERNRFIRTPEAVVAPYTKEMLQAKILSAKAKLALLESRMPTAEISQEIDTLKTDIEHMQRSMSPRVIQSCHAAKPE